MPGAHVFCWDCASHADVSKVASNLRCRCGSSDIDLYDPESEGQRQRIAMIASLHAPKKPVDFVSFMTKEAYTDPKPVGTEIPGWDVYKGPMPGKNPLQNSDDAHMKPLRCPVCHGAGYDIQDRGPCRECGGTGFMTPTTTTEPPAVARHNYPSTQTTVPFMGKKREATKPSVTTENSRATKAPDWWQPKEYTHKQESPLVLRGARCPNGKCDSPNTHLVTAANGNGWWSCPSCGPLADIDRHPDIDPYNPPSGFKPKPRSFKAATRVLHTAAGSRVTSIFAAITEHNPGLTPQETLGLARQTARRYPEAQ
jgi:hypothetical protein